MYLLLRCKAAAQKIGMYLEGTLLSSTTFPPQSPCKISLVRVGVSFFLFFHDTVISGGHLLGIVRKNEKQKSAAAGALCWLMPLPGSEVFLK
jgi:hypothetical protein